MKNEDMDILIEIISCCDDIDALIKESGDDFEDFQRIRSFRYSCYYCVLRLEELISRLPDEYISEYQELPWDNVRRTAKLCLQACDLADMKKVWKVLKKDIPEFSEKLSSNNNNFEMDGKMRRKYDESEFVEGVFYGRWIRFRRCYSDYRLSDNEVDGMLRGYPDDIEYTNENGEKVETRVHLQQRHRNGKYFFELVSEGDRDFREPYDAKDIDWNV